MAWNPVLRHSGSRAGWLAGLALCAVCAMPSAAQNPAAPNAAAQPQGAAHPSSPVKRAARSRKLKAETPPAVVDAPRPPDPPPPDWPVNDKAVPATVAWDGRALKIAAANSSLDQILRDVSTATGVKVQGMGNATSDQRIYGSYGPAAARDVLSQLLDGSGYNVMMVGDQGEGTPRELVLTARTNSGAAPNTNPNAQAGQNSDEDAQPEEPEPAEQPDPTLRRPFGGPPQPGQGRTPQQMLQEMQQRQLQMQQQQPPDPNQPPPRD